MYTILSPAQGYLFMSDTVYKSEKKKEKKRW